MPSSGPTSKAHRPRRPFAEVLEARRLFFALTIDGTGSGDAISIGIQGSDILFVVNGVSDTRSNTLIDDIVINGNGGADTVSIISNFLENTIVVNGGAGNDTINIGNGDQTADSGGGITVNGGSETDRLKLFDSGRSGTLKYDILPTRVDLHALFSSDNQASFGYGGVENLEIVGGSNQSFFSVHDAPGANLILDGGASPFPGDALEIEGASNESVTLIPGVSPTATYQGKSITTTNVEQTLAEGLNVTIQAATANESYDVNANGNYNVFVNTGGAAAGDVSVRLCTSVLLDMAANDGGAGNDFVNFNGDWVASDTININAGTGTNDLRIKHAVELNTEFGTLKGQNVRLLLQESGRATLAGSQTAIAQVMYQSDAALLDLAGTTAVANIGTLELNSAGGSLSVALLQAINVTTAFKIGAHELHKLNLGSLNILSTATQSHTSGAKLSVDAGVVNLNSDPAAGGGLILSVGVLAGASVNFGTTAHLKDLAISDGTAKIKPDAGRVLVVDTLALVGTGAIDVTDNSMIVRNTAGVTVLPALDTAVRAGLNNGTWTGPGIRSSSAASTPGTAVGFGPASDVVTNLPGVFLGQSVAAGSVVFRHTIQGDANLDRAVNFSDLVILAQNYNASARSFTRGNFDFDAQGKVDFADLVLMAQHYNNTLLTAEVPAKRRAAK